MHMEVEKSRENEREKKREVDWYVCSFLIYLYLGDKPFQIAKNAKIFFTHWGNDMIKLNVIIASSVTGTKRLRWDKVVAG